MLERYAGLVQQIKEKSKERKALLAEKKETPFYQTPKRHDLTRRIAELTEELEEYFSAKFPVYAALVNSQYAGYVVCCADSEVVWVESIFVKEEYRRHGVMHSKAEKIAASYGDDTGYNYVHPNNHRMIEFLRKRGDTVLNLIEIRRPYKDEKLTQTIAVGEHEFDY